MWVDLTPSPPDLNQERFTSTGPPRLAGDWWCSPGSCCCSPGSKQGPVVWFCLGSQEEEQPVHHLLLEEHIHAWGSHFKQKVEKLPELLARALIKRESWS